MSRVGFTSRKVYTSNIIKYNELEEIKDFSKLKLNDMIVVLDKEGNLECLRKLISVEDKYIVIGNPMESTHNTRIYRLDDNRIKLYKVKDEKYNMVQRRIHVAHEIDLAKKKQI
ncbi:hypothetical protein UT300012_22550 [Paraclostridium bifermentans]